MDAVERILSAGTLLQLQSLFRAAIAQFEFEHFAGGCLVDRNKPASMFLLDWPEAWAQEYSANGYAASDPTVPRALASCEPFTLDELWESHRKHPVLEAAIAFGWKAVFVVPVHGPAEKKGMVCMASLRRVAVPANFQDLRDIATAAYRQGYSLNRCEADEPLLSPRQREVLLLAARGLTDQQIGARLRISPHTAHTHVENAKARLGAKSRAQAIALAASHQLL